MEKCARICAVVAEYGRLPTKTMKRLAFAGGVVVESWAEEIVLEGLDRFVGSEAVAGTLRDTKSSPVAMSSLLDSIATRDFPVTPSFAFAFLDLRSDLS